MNTRYYHSQQLIEAVDEQKKFIDVVKGHVAHVCFGQKREIHPLEGSAEVKARLLVNSGYAPEEVVNHVYKELMTKGVFERFSSDRGYIKWFIGIGINRALDDMLPNVSSGRRKRDPIIHAKAKRTAAAKTFAEHTEQHSSIDAEQVLRATEDEDWLEKFYGTTEPVRE